MSHKTRQFSAGNRLRTSGARTMNTSGDEGNGHSLDRNVSLGFSLFKSQATATLGQYKCHITWYVISNAHLQVLRFIGQPTAA